ncbi:MAG: DUF11 domain-containing protein [Clostridia bacterium]|nr:DUF11 domain-containing protein [Clostridia bacterium]
MAQFTNQAQITYGNVVANSNIAVGEIVSVLSATKTAIRENYTQDSDITYIVSIINSGNTPITNLTVNDNLGAYPFGIGTLVPLDYIDGTLRFFVNGIAQPTPTIDTENGLNITGVTIPAGGSALLVYETNANRFAPINEGGTITNEVVITGDCGNVTASATVTAVSTPQISITKAVSPVPVACGDTVTYTFLLQNYGANPLVAADNAVVTDIFNPILSNVTATLNGVAIPFTYDETTGAFSTNAGAVTVPAATITQDLTTGAWTVTPGSSTLVVTGII